MYQHIGSEGHCVHSHCTVLYRWDLHHQWTARCMEFFFQQVIVYCTLVLYSAVQVGPAPPVDGPLHGGVLPAGGQGEGERTRLLTPL